MRSTNAGAQKHTGVLHVVFTCGSFSGGARELNHPSGATSVETNINAVGCQSKHEGCGRTPPPLPTRERETPRT